jgi:hypothetical protein
VDPLAGPDGRPAERGGRDVGDLQAQVAAVDSQAHGILLQESAQQRHGVPPFRGGLGRCEQEQGAGAVPALQRQPVQGRTHPAGRAAPEFDQAAGRDVPRLRALRHVRQQIPERAAAHGASRQLQKGGRLGGPPDHDAVLVHDGSRQASEAESRVTRILAGPNHVRSRQAADALSTVTPGPVPGPSEQGAGHRAHERTGKRTAV